MPENIGNWTETEDGNGFYGDVDCQKCGHHARHVFSRNTGNLYCLGCAGTCKSHEPASAVA